MQRIKKKRQKNDQIVLIVKAQLNMTEILISINLLINL